MDEHKPKPVGRPKAVKSEAEKQAQAAEASIRNTLNRSMGRKAIKEQELDAGIVRKRRRPTKHKGGEDAPSERLR